MIRARLEEGYEQNSGSPGILEGSKELLGTSEIGIARSLVVQKAGQTLVRVANFSDKVVRLRSDLPVAEYHPVSGVNGSATPTEIGPRPSAPNHPYCSVIDRNMGDPWIIKLTLVRMLRLSRFLVAYHRTRGRS